MSYKKVEDSTPQINLDNYPIASGTTNIMIPQEQTTGSTNIMTDQEPEVTGFSFLMGQPIKNNSLDDFFSDEEEEENKQIELDPDDFFLDEDEIKEKNLKEEKQKIKEKKIKEIEEEIKNKEEENEMIKNTVKQKINKDKIKEEEKKLLMYIELNEYINNNVQQPQNKNIDKHFLSYLKILKPNTNINKATFKYLRNFMNNIPSNTRNDIINKSKK
jgi:hypothetical protein